MGARIIVGLAAMLAWGTAAGAQGIAGEPAAGQELSARLCSNCHATDPDASRVARADVPSFRSIANAPTATADRIAGAIVMPHPEMPGVPLTRAEIRDIIAYILSLRKTP